jgi:hypothetical protein
MTTSCIPAHPALVQRLPVRRRSVAATILAPAVSLALLAWPLAAQDVSLPAGWRAVPDSAARLVAPGVEPGLTDAWNFTRMPPGWHITTGPGMVLYDQHVRAAGRYRIETEFFLFPNPTDQPVGLFLGATGLDGPLAEVQWFGLLVRRDGTAGVVHAHGTEHHPVVPYARADSLAVHPGNDSQRIGLAVDVEADSVRFFVNRARFAAVPREGLALDGPFGFRVGRGLNLHVVSLDHTQRLAPARGQ